MNKKQLQLKAVQIRKDALQMIYNAKTGHTGGMLSSIDILVALHYSIMNIDPKNPKMENRDRFVLSKGHSVEGYYCVLADLGFFPKAELDKFSSFNAMLIGHPNNKVPGVEMNTGALGHGLSIGVGMAIASKKKALKNSVYVLMGDGELAEGSLWEAAMSASNYKLDNLYGIIDRNNLQISGNTEDVMKLEALEDKWKAFGWQTTCVNGNDPSEVVQALQSFKEIQDKPKLIIANTVKGKGVSYMENVAKWHHGVPSEEQFKIALDDLDQLEKELQANE